MKYNTAIRWSLIWETPTSLNERDDLKDIVDANVRYMDQPHYHALCSWSLDYVQACMILILHAFHCPQVQSHLSPDRRTWSVEDRAEQEKIDQKKQDCLNVGEVANNSPIMPIIWGGTYRNVKKSDFPQP